MKIYLLAAVVLLSSATWAGAADSKICFELALATMRSEKPKVPRSKCETCHGTGKVKSGDTIVVTDSDCPDCYPDTPAAPPLVAEKPELLPVPPQVKIEVDSLKGCVPCISTRKALEALVADGTFKESDFEINYGRPGPYPRVRIMIDGEIKYNKTGFHSSATLKSLKRQYEAIAIADQNFQEWGPSDWREFCKAVNLAAYTKGMTQFYHITNHHGKWKLRPDQIQGLTANELVEVHGWQHTHGDLE